MSHQLMHLPYIHYWLPAAAALAVTLPLLWFVRPRRTTSAPVDDVSAGETPAAEPDPFVVGSATEKRKAFRRQGNLVRIACTHAKAPDRPFDGYVLDRSTGGLRLLLPAPFNPEVVLSVRPADASPVVPWVQVEVRSCRASTIQAGHFELGCQFVRIPSYSTLFLFG